MKVIYKKVSEYDEVMKLVRLICVSNEKLMINIHSGELEIIQALELMEFISNHENIVSFDFSVKHSEDKFAEYVRNLIVDDMEKISRDRKVCSIPRILQLRNVMV